MAAYSKYYKQQKQVSYDYGVTWENLNEYQKGALIDNHSSDCGYVAAFERWVNSGFTCDGLDKYYVQVKEISDDGITWTATTDSRVGDLAQSNSTDCGFIEPIYKWEPDTSQSPNSYGKWRCYTAIKMVSYDNGLTWSNVVPLEVKSDGFCSGYCDCYCWQVATPSHPQNCGWVFAPTYLVNGEPHSIHWMDGANGSSLMTQGIISKVPGDDSNITELNILSCCSGLDNDALYNCTRLEYVKLPCSTKYIKSRNFNSAWLDVLEIDAKEPPELSPTAFVNNHKPIIKVHRPFVQDYKDAWPELESRIESIE